MTKQAQQASKPSNSPRKPHVTNAWLGPKADYRPMMPVTDPEIRIVFGVVMILIGVLGFGLPGLERVRYWMLGMTAFGLCMIGSARLQRRHEARTRREIERAKAEWHVLLSEAAAARRQGEGIVRVLQQRGYRDFFVRRWIADSLANELLDREPSRRS